MEVAVCHDFGIRSISGIGIDVSLVAVYSLAADSEEGSIEYMERAVLKCSLDFSYLLNSAGSCNISVDLGEQD